MAATGISSGPAAVDAETIRAVADRRYIWQNIAKTEVDPLILREGRGVRVTDVDGAEYIDLMSSASRASTLGYGHPAIVDAMHEQLGRLHLAGTRHQVGETTIRFAQRVAEVAPVADGACMFVGSGSEAVECSIKLARSYHRAAGRKPHAFKVISRWGAFHGAVGNAMAVSDSMNVRGPYEPGVPGVSHIPGPTCYRWPFDVDYSTWSAICAESLEQEILREGPELVAAFIAEPVMQFNGAQPPPPDYLSRVREICVKYDVLFIADEIICGFGRTGEWFGVDHWDVEPDIVTSAKGLTAGYAPMSAVVASQSIWEAVPMLPDIHTYAGPPPAAAAGLAVAEVLERESLIARGKQLGADTLDRLRALEELDLVGQVRGLGMWVAIDFTFDKATRELPDPAFSKRVARRARDLGALAGATGTSVEVAPALNISLEDLDAGLSILERAVGEARRD